MNNNKYTYLYMYITSDILYHMLTTVCTLNNYNQMRILFDCEKIRGVTYH